MMSSVPESVKNVLSVCSFDVVMNDHVSESFSISESNVVAYIGGYNVRKLRKSVCIKKLTSAADEVVDDDIDDCVENVNDESIKCKKILWN